MKWGRGFAVLILSCAVSVASNAQEFPSQPIKFIVPFSPGTGSDAIARIMANAMTPEMGQSIIVENRGGAGGITGTDQGARSNPDGYTLTVGTTSTLITNPVLNPMVKYNVEKDFIPVVGFGRTFFAVVTANSAEAPKTLRELLDRLKSANGSFGSSGVGTITHLASEALVLRAQVKATHIPYKGSGQSLTDVAAGHTLFASDTLAATLPLIKSGRLRALAVTSLERVTALPDVPTIAESGFPNFLVDSWWGLLAPVGTPPAVVKKISDIAIRSLSSAETKGRFAPLELDPLPLAGPAFGDYIKKQTPFWVNFLKQANIKLEN